jgi:hypothetical protein
MTDDYQYQPQPLPLKNEGLFGYGGKPSEGSRGFQGSVTDYAGVNGVQGGGSDLLGGGIQGPPGPPGELVPGNQGDMLYNDGTDWLTFAKPPTDGVLSITNGIPNWITTNRNGSLIYYNGDLGVWVPLPAPLGSETYVLGFKNNALEWMQTTDCDEPEE